MKTISILIPTHNRPDGFQRCIKSVLNQTYGDMEVIVSNDSDDKSNYVMPKGIKYFEIETETPNENYDNLFKNCTGDYIMVLEDDDFLANDGVIENQVKILEEYDPIMIVNDYINVTYWRRHSHEKGLKKCKDILFSWYDLEHYQFSQIVFKGEITKEINLRELNYSVYNDNLYMLLSLIRGENVYFSGEITFGLSVGEDSMSWKNKVDDKKNHILDFISDKIVEKYGSKEASTWRRNVRIY